MTNGCHSTARGAKHRQLLLVHHVMAWMGVLLVCGVRSVFSASYTGNFVFGPYVIGSPLGVWLSPGNNATSCVVSWSNSMTIDYSNTSLQTFAVNIETENDGSAYYGEIRWGSSPTALVRAQIDLSSPYMEPRCSTSRVLNSVYLYDCYPGATFYYRVRTMALFLNHTNGPCTNWSEVFQGTIWNEHKPESNMTMTIAMIGDHSNTTTPDQLTADEIDPATMDGIDELSTRASRHEIDMIFHVGDIAYNLDDYCGDQGDHYFQRMQPLATQVPIVYVQGDHEQGRQSGVIPHTNTEDFEAFMNRMGGRTNSGQLVMTRLSSPSPFYWSYNVGLIHVLAITTHAYFRPSLYWLLSYQYEFVKQDLKQVNRSVTPWVIVLGHRSLYCTRGAQDECTLEAKMLRDGLAEQAYLDHVKWNTPGIDNGNTSTRIYGLRTLMDEYSVDLYVGGHTHHYERSYPLYNNTVIDDPVMQHGTIYIVNGKSSGNRADVFQWGLPFFTAYRDQQYRVSFGTFQVQNATHATWTQIQSNTGQIIDSTQMMKNHDHTTNTGGEDQVLPDPNPEIPPCSAGVASGLNSASAGALVGVFVAGMFVSFGICVVCYWYHVRYRGKRVVSTASLSKSSSLEMELEMDAEPEPEPEPDKGVMSGLSLESGTGAG